MNDDAGPFIVRWQEVPERMAHQLLLLRRAGQGRVEWLEQWSTEHGPGWHWVTSDPGVTLEPDQGVVLEVPSEALEPIRAALEATLGLPPATAEAQVLRAAWENERGYVRQLLSMVAVVLGRSHLPTGS